MNPKLNPSYIEIEPSEQAMAAIDAALDTIEANATFLRTLTAKRRMVLRGLGVNMENFAALTVIGGKQNEDLLPRGFDIAKVERDRDVREQLMARLARLQKITEAFDDTVLLLGTNYYKGCLAIYGFLKKYRHFAGVRSLLRDLGQFFNRKRSVGNEPGTETV